MLCFDSPSAYQDQRAAGEQLGKFYRYDDLMICDLGDALEAMSDGVGRVRV